MVAVVALRVRSARPGSVRCITTNPRAPVPPAGTVAGRRPMIEAPWAHRPRPDLISPAQPILRGAPSSLAELRALRLQLRSALSNGGRPAGADADDLDRLLLAFEELVSNGLRHGGSPVRVVVTAAGSAWLVEVSDAAGDSPPVPAVGRDAALGGLGLYLVAQLSGAHGWAAENDGRKVVWARVDFTGEAAPALVPPGDSGRQMAPRAQSPEIVPSGADATERVRPTRGRTQPGDRRAGTHPRKPRTTPRRLGAIVVAVVLLITLALAWLASAVNSSNNERLLRKQVDQVATLLSTQIAVLQTQMSDAAQVAVATDGRPGPFTNFAAATVPSPQMSLSLWRVTGDQADRLALHGPAPLLPADGPASFFTDLEPTGSLSVAGILEAPSPGWRTR